MTPQLTDRERKVLAQILAPFADKISSVGVFGSRASGKAEANSDIDLVIYGDFDENTEAELWTLFDESNLAVSVDVVSYRHIKHDALKQHIDKAAIELFSQADLLRERMQAER